MTAEMIDPTEYQPPEHDLLREAPEEPVAEFAPWENLAEEDFLPGGHDPSGPAVSPFKAHMMVTDITADLLYAQYNDPPLTNDLMNRFLTELTAAASTQTGHLSVWAAGLLDAAWHRSRSGVPYGEPQHPADSLDPEPRRRNRGPRLDG